MDRFQVHSYWIQAMKELPVFVKNRISEIKSDENIKFKHVPGEQNPADIASRGCSLQTICVCDLWWHGPIWLQQPKSTLSRFNSNISSSDSSDYNALNYLEKVMIKVFEKEKRNVSPPLEVNSDKYSSLTKMLRVTELDS